MYESTRESAEYPAAPPWWLSCARSGRQRRSRESAPKTYAEEGNVEQSDQPPLD